MLWSLKNKAASDYTRPNNLKLDERWRRGLAAVWMQFMGLLEYKTWGQVQKVDIYGSTRLRLSSATGRSIVVAGSLQGDDNFLAFFFFSFPHSLQAISVFPSWYLVDLSLKSCPDGNSCVTSFNVPSSVIRFTGYYSQLHSRAARLDARQTLHNRSNPWITPNFSRNPIASSDIRIFNVRS